VLAFLGTALAGDEVRGLLALALFIGAYARKMWIEEQWLVRQFGEEYAGQSLLTFAIKSTKI